MRERVDEEVDEQFDVVVIGSGPVGAAFARTVKDGSPQSRVLVVEVGPPITKVVGYHVRNIEDPRERLGAQIKAQGPFAGHEYSGGDYTIFQRGYGGIPGSSIDLLTRAGLYLADPDAAASDRDGMPAANLAACIGGMGVQWSGACPRPGGAERIPFIPAGEFAAALAEADALLHVTATELAGSPFGEEVRAALAEEFDDGRGADRRVQPMPLAVRVDGGRARWSGVDSVFGELVTVGRDGFELRSNTLCRRLLTSAGAVTGVEIEDRATGHRSTVGARIVFVGADALRTPQLLVASGIEQPAIGHYLNDQPVIMSAVRLSPELRGRVDSAPDEAGANGASWVPYVDGIHPFHGQITQSDASPVPLPEEDGVEPGSIVGLGWFCPKDIRYEDAVVFSDTETDFFGMPTMSIEYGLTAEDSRVIAEAEVQLRRAAAVLGPYLLDEEVVVMPNGFSLHYQGSTRMGEVNDGTSVCDSFSRVWGYDNLYLGGNNVIPTPTACNPTVTSVALAVRAAWNAIDLLGG